MQLKGIKNNLGVVQQFIDMIERQQNKMMLLQWKSKAEMTICVTGKAAKRPEMCVYRVIEIIAMISFKQIMII